LINDREKIIHSAKHPEEKIDVSKIPESETLVGKTGEFLREKMEDVKELFKSRPAPELDDSSSFDEEEIDHSDEEDELFEELNEERSEKAPNQLGKTKQFINDNIEKVKELFTTTEKETDGFYTEEDEDEILSEATGNNKKTEREKLNSAKDAIV